MACSTSDPAVVPRGVYRMISMVTSRPPLVRLRWILISALGVVPPLFFFAVWLRGFWAVEKDARSAHGHRVRPAPTGS